MIQIVIGRGKQNWNEGILQTASNKISDYAQDFLSVVKSQRNGSDAASLSGKTKLVSLVLEGDDGKLSSFKREVRSIETDALKDTIDTIEQQLSELDDFHKINVLQQLLRKSLEAQS